MGTLPEQPDGNIPLLYTAFFKNINSNPSKIKILNQHQTIGQSSLYDRQTRPVGVSPILPT
jgi:hypothetical protein